MNKLLVYPFTKELCPLIRNRSLIKEYELVSAVPHKGFGWEGKDICEIDGGEPTGFILGQSFTEELDRCDSILFDINRQAVEKEYSVYIDKARSSLKEIVTIIPNDVTVPEVDIQANSILKEIPVPVIMVMGLGENCQKFDIQLGLREAFLKAGYKVSQFGTKPYCSLFGFERLPDIPEKPLFKKIFMYNSLFWDTCLRENPDIIIVGVPGGIMPISSHIHGLFGETALALSYSATPDATILSYYHTAPSEEYFDMLSHLCRYRLGASDIFFHASATQIIFEDSGIADLSYPTLKSQFVLDNINMHAPDLSAVIFNSLISESSSPFYQKVIEKLQDNVSEI